MIIKLYHPSGTYAVIHEVRKLEIYQFRDTNNIGMLINGDLEFEQEKTLNKSDVAKIEIEL